MSSYWDEFLRLQMGSLSVLDVLCTVFEYATTSRSYFKIFSIFAIFRFSGAVGTKLVTNLVPKAPENRKFAKKRFFSGDKKQKSTVMTCCDVDLCCFLDLKNML